MKYKIVIAGFGTVGQGFAELLIQKQHLLKEKYKLEYSIVGIIDLSFGLIYNENGFDLSELIQLTESGKNFYEKFDEFRKDNAKEILRYSEYDILVETTPTNLKTGLPASTFISEALKHGKHTITTNKGPIALRYKELSKIVNDNKAHLRFEGTVLSGTPVFNLIRASLTGTNITSIEGILNGTSNYILTEMRNGIDYDSALKKAQDLGYAETKPSADVDGWDAVAKVMILSAVVFDKPLNVENVEREGITGINQQKILEATNEKKVWKLLAEIEQKDGKVKASVKTVKLDVNHPLASVDGATNAVKFTTDVLGEVTVTGAGAGKLETGYAILNDLISIVKAN